MNPNEIALATLEQIQQTPSRRDGISQELEEDLRAYGAKLIQQAGFLLKQYVFLKSVETPAKIRSI
jgi:hypothetical protein